MPPCIELEDNFTDVVFSPLCVDSGVELRLSGLRANSSPAELSGPP